MRNKIKFDTNLNKKCEFQNPGSTSKSIKMISSKNVIMVRGLLRSKPTKMAQALMSTKPQEDGEKSSGKNEHF